MNDFSVAVYAKVIVIERSETVAACPVPIYFDWKRVLIKRRPCFSQGHFYCFHIISFFAIFYKIFHIHFVSFSILMGITGTCGGCFLSTNDSAASGLRSPFLSIEKTDTNVNAATTAALVYSSKISTRIRLH